MIRIHCPFCGARPHSEFVYGGDASVAYPPQDASAQAWHDAVFLRENICGTQAETWQHLHGCRMWLVVTRNTQTHEIMRVVAADEKLQAFAKNNFAVPAAASTSSTKTAAKPSAKPKPARKKPTAKKR